MDPSAPPQTPPSETTTENPVVAVGRKVKSVLSTHQRPSVRIRRVAPPTRTAEQDPARLPSREKAYNSGTHASSASANVSTSRFSQARSRVAAGLGSLFGHPEVSTLSTLTNVQNSLFVPSLGRLLNRRPTYRISEEPEKSRTIDKLKASLKRIATSGEARDGKEKKTKSKEKPPPLSDAQYAVLPDGETLEGWTYEEQKELDDLVRHMLHSRRARFKRSMKGFWQYVRRPLGLFITVYATLITLFGAAWVLFLIGWISLGSKRDYIVNVVDNVLVALFAIIGDGLAPFRAVDTYHMIYIAHYHRKTWKKREKLGLPDLVDHNDLPDQRKEDVKPAKVDLESLVARKMPRGLARRVAPRIPKRLARRIVTRSDIQDRWYEYSVLSKEEQAKLEFHERKFSKSHTFYKPHETETHFAFPLKLLVAIVVLLDFHSALQITLGACTWGISYKTRPFALTTVILCCSITCNIMGGVLISIGDKRTRKQDVIDRLMRQELTSEAIEQQRTRRLREAEERGEIDPSIRKKQEEEREEEENEEIKKAWKGVPLLPKKLLGKGEDHRQPALPQKARRSGSGAASTSSGSSAPKTSKSKSSTALPPVQEDSSRLTRPPAALRRHDEPPQEGTGQKVMRLIRRADLDRS
ncbi:MAG: hypothetical protein Q9227_002169 [Pyrenula ochraceoflavens]